ncbi:cell division protein ZapB [Nocardia sp. NPDC050712]|uniref:cell division protein ZapB n=1 Tax=Actinomycetes TaxID=1760 RepID=UPI0033D70B58
MKLLHQARPDIQLRLENTELRRQNASLFDQLAAAQAEIIKAKNEVASVRSEIDDLLDLAMAFTLAPSAERLGTAHSWPWQEWAHHDDRDLTVDQAHAVMQQHRDCVTGDCQVRTTAVRVLRDAGHMAADSCRRSPLVD